MSKKNNIREKIGAILFAIGCVGLSAEFTPVCTQGVKFFWSLTSFFLVALGLIIGDFLYLPTKKNNILKHNLKS